MRCPTPCAAAGENTLQDETTMPLGGRFVLLLIGRRVPPSRPCPVRAYGRVFLPSSLSFFSWSLSFFLSSLSSFSSFLPFVYPSSLSFFLPILSFLSPSRPSACPPLVPFSPFPFFSPGDAVLVSPSGFFCIRPGVDIFLLESVVLSIGYIFLLPGYFFHPSKNLYLLLLRPRHGAASPPSRSTIFLDRKS